MPRGQNTRRFRLLSVLVRAMNGLCERNSETATDAPDASISRPFLGWLTHTEVLEPHTKVLTALLVADSAVECVASLGNDNLPYATVSVLSSVYSKNRRTGATVPGVRYRAPPVCLRSVLSSQCLLPEPTEE